MGLIKRHKGLAIVGGLALIFLIIMFIIFARIAFGSGKTEYGDRLKGIPKITSKDQSEIVEKIKEKDEVEDVKIRKQGKIIYTTIYYKEDTSTKKAKEIAAETLEFYEKEIISSYDFGYFLIETTEEEEGYKIAGTKHPDNEEIAWTKG